jgi:hypothetical protein
MGDPASIAGRRTRRDAVSIDKVYSVTLIEKRMGNRHPDDARSDDGYAHARVRLARVIRK